MRDPLLAQIHIAKKDLNLDEDSYRAALVLATQVVDNATGEIIKAGKDSSGAMTQTERQRVVTHFKSLGWKPRKLTQRKGKRRQYAKATSRKMVVIWRQLYDADKVANKTQQAMETWVSNQTGKKNPDWLTPQEASDLIEQLKHWRDR